MTLGLHFLVSNVCTWTALGNMDDNIILTNQMSIQRETKFRNGLQNTQVGMCLEKSCIEENESLQYKLCRIPLLR